MAICCCFVFVFCRAALTCGIPFRLKFETHERSRLSYFLKGQKVRAVLAKKIIGPSEELCFLNPREKWLSISDDKVVTTGKHLLLLA